MNALANPELAKAAVDAVKQWHYEPTLLNGNPVEVATTIAVNFKLR
jgi:protein TonB